VQGFAALLDFWGRGESLEVVPATRWTSVVKIKLLMLIAAAVPASTIYAQPAGSSLPQPEFEAASIRMVEGQSLEDLKKGIGIPSVSRFPTNLFTAKLMPLRVIIQLAYGVDGTRIDGKPDWLDNQLYNITAKADGDELLTHEQMEPLLQNLLEQRFHLKIHRDSRSVLGYFLVVAKGGAKLHPSEEGVNPLFYVLSNGLEGHGTNMAVLSGMLERPAGRPVIDHTGITGKYEINIQYATTNDQKSDLPDLFAAVQQQLGLKLVPQKVPVDYLVIDHVDRVPTEN
jgi:uncharacterized protein (TIGR03435 family)